MGDGVARSFLRALVVLIGGYREALQFRSGEEITFNDESFVASRPQTLRPFLSSMLHLQIFQQVFQHFFSDLAITVFFTHGKLVISYSKRS